MLAVLRQGDRGWKRVRNSRPSRCRDATRVLRDQSARNLRATRRAPSRDMYGIEVPAAETWWLRIVEGDHGHEMRRCATEAARHRLVGIAVPHTSAKSQLASEHCLRPPVNYFAVPERGLVPHTTGLARRAVPAQCCVANARGPVSSMRFCLPPHHHGRVRT